MSDSKPVTLDDLLVHRWWVRSLALRLAADEATANDLEQETWLAALRTPPPQAGSPRSWLGTVLRNLARTAARRRKRRRRYETTAAAAAPSRVASPAEIVAEAEVQTQLALGYSLPAKNT